MNSIYEKEKKLNKALEKLNSINPKKLNLKEAISNLDQQKNQLKIVTIATGRNNPNKIVNFFEEYNLSNLENYRDPKGKLALDLGVIGLPFSIIISKDKKDIARLIGPIDWSKKEVEDLFLELIQK